MDQQENKKDFSLPMEVLILLMIAGITIFVEFKTFGNKYKRKNRDEKAQPVHRNKKARYAIGKRFQTFIRENYNKYRNLNEYGSHYQKGQRSSTRRKSRRQPYSTKQFFQ